MNFPKALMEITIPLQKCSEAMTLKTKCNTSKFKPR